MQTLGPRGRRAARGIVAAGMYVVLASFAPGAEPAPLAPLDRLRAGNQRFVKGASAAPTASARHAPANEQFPVAIVLSCAESRVPPELVFDAGLGELYVVRNLGGVADRAVVASLEHGVEHVRAPLLVVMGHDSCDAVRLAADAHPATSASLEFLVKTIRAGSPRPAVESADLRAAVLANVEQVINDALGASPVLRTAAAAGRLQIVGAYYEATSGLVTFSEPVAAAAMAYR